MKPAVKQIILAPMEGVMDELMREIITSINHFDLCVSEFVRIVDQLLPKQVFYRSCPELNRGGFTSSNTPLRVQLLGQHPDWMAENAVRAIELGSHGIDINFGCPAKTVNKNRGGAALLKTPELIYEIVSTVRNSIDSKHVVSVKIRLGFDDSSLLDEIVDAISLANADLLTIHARTKKQGYQPPAYWQHIGAMQQKYTIPLVANGEIWCATSAADCMNQARTNNIMLGRGILALPNLANVIRHNEAPMPWSSLCHLIQRYSSLALAGDKSFYFSSRLKQWLNYLKKQYPQAEWLFSTIKTLKDKESILAAIADGYNG